MTRFGKIFDSVCNEVVMGNAHLELWRGLAKRLRESPFVANTARTFFGMTLESHLDTAFLYAAKIFDRNRGSLSLWTVLRYAEENKRSLPGETSTVIERVVAGSRVELTKLDDSLKAVRTRRDKVIAHLDAQFVSNPEKVAEQSQIAVNDLQKIFVVAFRLLNNISIPYWQSSASLELIGVNDFEHALQLIEREKKRERAEYEAEFGSLP
jgi:HEPN superfamily AbiU2-like protein